MQHFFIGVDGGATKSIVRLEDANGVLLGQEMSGPANIRLSVDLSWQSILTALTYLLQRLDLSLDKSDHQFHAGMGLAGCEMVEAFQAFQARTHAFSTLVVSSDSHTACLGAHGGEDGAIIIAGTGVVGFQIESHHSKKVSGWGFPMDDEGGGAWLGLQAVNITFKWMDGRMPVSALAKAVYAHFGNEERRLVHWSNHANSTAFAELAPLVITHAESGDAIALNLLKKAAQAIDEIGRTLLAAQKQAKPLPCSLVGGITPFLKPHLSPELRARLHSCQLTPDAGAILLVKEYLANKEAHDE